ncbi:DUF2946 family protein [Phenylobacterium sp. SCN 70-31]|uniref:DUF2946 family protein n=1 Tax=Phenylobacterium sp. SCN 70-31 TaxID=1660129 RepID=UPI0025CDB9C0|nr:DUF2946 family protein [Phenylobacterium sp. SCN 70-31]
MIAIIAVFALLVQALLPTLAAATPASSGQMTLCTEMGLQTAPVDPGAPPVSHNCKHCLCPAPANTPPPILVVSRVAYAVEIQDAPPAPQLRIPPARAPPRPPGQGPPLHTA